MTEVDDCFKKRLLIKSRPSRELAGKSIRQAEHFLEKAENYLKLEDVETISIYLYYAFFHAARALLFKDGIKERSHYCTLTYLEHAYIKSGQISENYLNILRALKESRQEIQYGFIIDNTLDLDILKDYSKKGKSFIKEIGNNI
ncbi:MAG: HEPN domain-containing protein [Candidatus Margulisiibacteriota bacterium]|nr:HEPN domain-containing protein [Candidatus Margulisiibacteriota bacterium]